MSSKFLSVRTQASLALANLGTCDDNMGDIFMEALSDESLRVDAGRGISLWTRLKDPSFEVI
jgi:hypothetical protein